MKLRLYSMVGALGISLVIALSGCGASDASCSTSADCSADQQCLWKKEAGRVVGRMCVTPCSDQPSCAAEEVCGGTATSCPDCRDQVRVCQY